MNRARQNLIQTLIQHMMSIMRHGHHSGPLPQPVLTPTQGGLLFTIAHNKDGIPVKDLAKEIGVTSGAITQLVDSLVDKGLVMREGDTNDRRIVRLKLTESARNEFEKVRKAHLESFSSIFAVLSDEEIKQLTALLTKVDIAYEHKE
jgi:DNA-binding MarR family transcriptional regulator